MALTVNSMDSISMHEKIHRRSGHIAVMYKNWLIVWGGYVDHMQETSTSQIQSAYHYTDELWIYDCLSELWERVLTKGDIPPRNSGSCGVLHEDCLYIFGGFHGQTEPGSMDGNSNQLFRLHLCTMTWEWLHPTGEQPTPCDKLAGWVYNNKLYFFGGFGPQPDFGAPFQHVVDPSTELSGWPRGWNNQLVVYNPATDEWEWPRTRGTIPSPRAAHAADITGHKVFVFGGRIGNTRNNDLHCLDLDKMRWSGNLTRPFELNPEGRSWHSFTFITESRAVLYGGLNQFNTVLRPRRGDAGNQLHSQVTVEVVPGRSSDVRRTAACRVELAATEPTECAKCPSRSVLVTSCRHVLSDCTKTVCEWSARKMRVNSNVASQCSVVQ
ncbi:kelch domain-containing protein 2-like isoform X3 [Periplaneta americana]|uniref:kelch domain-containing protein 2-like isoform X3 n=1 Tax=Periplaneta americana TaxID=6978 RepID=UPI0037E91F7B